MVFAKFKCLLSLWMITVVYAENLTKKPVLTTTKENVPAAKPAKISALYISDLLRTNENTQLPAVSYSLQPRIIDSNQKAVLDRRTQHDYDSYESDENSRGELLPPLEPRKETSKPVSDNGFEKFLFRQSGILERNVLNAKKDSPASRSSVIGDSSHFKKKDCEKGSVHHEDYDRSYVPEQRYSPTYYQRSKGYEPSSHSEETPTRSTYRSSSGPSSSHSSRGNDAKKSYSKSRSTSTSESSSPNKDKVRVIHTKPNQHMYDLSLHEQRKQQADTTSYAPPPYEPNSNQDYDRSPHERHQERPPQYSNSHVRHEGNIQQYRDQISKPETYSRPIGKAQENTNQQYGYSSEPVYETQPQNQGLRPDDGQQTSHHRGNERLTYEPPHQYSDYDSREQYYPQQVEQSKRYSDDERREHRNYQENSTPEYHQRQNQPQTSYKKQPPTPYVKPPNVRTEYRDYTPAHQPPKSGDRRSHSSRDTIIAQQSQDQGEHSYKEYQPRSLKRVVATQSGPAVQVRSAYETPARDAPIEDRGAGSLVSKSISFSESMYIDDHPSNEPMFKPSTIPESELRFLPDGGSIPELQTSYKPFNSEYPAAYMVGNNNRSPPPEQHQPISEYPQTYENENKETYGSSEELEPSKGKITGYREQYDDSEPLYLDEDFFKKYKISNEAKIIVAKAMEPNLFVADGTQIQGGPTHDNPSKEFSPIEYSGEETSYRSPKTKLTEAHEFDEMVHSNKKFLANIPIDLKDTAEDQSKSRRTLKNSAPRIALGKAHERTVQHGDGESRVLYHRRDDNQKPEATQQKEVILPTKNDSQAEVAKTSEV